MKKAAYSILLITAAVLFPLKPASAQTASDILKKSYAKCQAVKNGYYEMKREFKSLAGQDTSVALHRCYFKRVENDSLYSAVFHQYYEWVNDPKKRKWEELHDGEVFVSIYPDSTGNVYNKQEWARKLKSGSKNEYFLHLYLPLVNTRSYPFQVDSLDNPFYTFRLVGKEEVMGTACYHIQVNEPPRIYSGTPYSRTEYHYWIDRKTFLPVRYTTIIDQQMEGQQDTARQWEQLTLTKHELNTMKDETPLTLPSIPAYIKLQEYNPRLPQATLPKDTTAPLWSLSTLEGKQVSLTDLQGKLVLIDFFYKSCHPCMLALPGLQKLHEKYKDRGLVVIGIDPYDKNVVDLPDFLIKRGVTYSVFMDKEQSVIKDYRVEAYPTLYLLDTKGRVLFSEIGYSKESIEGLEQMIEKQLSANEK